jgi:hypothetical protein
MLSFAFRSGLSIRVKTGGSRVSVTVVSSRWRQPGCEGSDILKHGVLLEFGSLAQSGMESRRVGVDIASSAASRFEKSYGTLAKRATGWIGIPVAASQNGEAAPAVIFRRDRRRRMNTASVCPSGEALVNGQWGLCRGCFQGQQPKILGEHSVNQPRHHPWPTTTVTPPHPTQR